MNTYTLISASLDPRALMPELDSDFGQLSGDSLPDRRHFKIETVDSASRRQSADQLLSERYGWRGYRAVSIPEVGTDRHVSLAATQDGATIGTMTVGFDGPDKMNCDAAFGTELDYLRASGREVCEFTKLAIDPQVGTKRVIAGLFHVAYIVAYRLRGVDGLVMEVNPRHVRYYERMLGAHVIGEERMNTKVHAPAVLLHLEFSYVREQIERFAGRPEQATCERSLYPFAFTAEDENGIVTRLVGGSEHTPMSREHPFFFRLPASASVSDEKSLMN
jgi:hypothetical protein